MEQFACAVGRLEPDGPWIGFAPSLDDGYELVVQGARRVPATGLDLLALAIAYFEDALAEPPEELAAMHGDIGALVRHVADLADTPPDLRARLADAIDAIDDGLAADAVITRLQAALEPGFDARSYLADRAGAAAARRTS